MLIADSLWAERVVVALLACVCDAFIGEPAGFWRRTGHPVQWMGWVIAAADQRLNDPGRSPTVIRNRGIAVMAAGGALSLTGGYALAMAFEYLGVFGLAANVLVVSVFFAQRSLVDHIEAILTPLARRDITGARRALGCIVGRSVDDYDETAIVNATLESLAENASDGVYAPLCAFLVGGLPGILLFKFASTADSMIGHKHCRWRHFGWCAAKTDDVLCWLPSRLSAALIAFSTALWTRSIANGTCVLRTARWQASRHASPNAGWPEAAFAAALRVRIGGPREYAAPDPGSPPLRVDGARFGLPHDQPPIANHLRLGIELLWRTSVTTAGFVLLSLLCTL